MVGAIFLTNGDPGVWIVGDSVAWGDGPVNFPPSSDYDPIQWDLWGRSAAKEVDDLLLIVEKQCWQAYKACHLAFVTSEADAARGHPGFAVHVHRSVPPLVPIGEDVAFAFTHHGGPWLAPVEGLQSVPAPF